MRKTPRINKIKLDLDSGLILFSSRTGTGSVNNPKLNSTNIYVRLEIVLFLYNFGSGFKCFSATIIRKLSKILNLRLSGGKSRGDLTHITQINTVLEKRSTRE